MDSRYVTYKDIELCLTTGDLNNIEALSQEFILVASVADLLMVVELFRKNKISIPKTDLINNFLNFQKNQIVYFPELDRRTILDNMFEYDNQITSLWKHACNKNISPRFSISLICLKPNSDELCTEKVFEDMIEYYTNLEGDA